MRAVLLALIAGLGVAAVQRRVEAKKDAELWAAATDTAGRK